MSDFIWWALSLKVAEGKRLEFDPAKMGRKPCVTSKTRIFRCIGDFERQRKHNGHYRTLSVG